MNLGSVGIVLKITFRVSYWIQLKFNTLPKQTTIAESSGIPVIANPKVD